MSTKVHVYPWDTRAVKTFEEIFLEAEKEDEELVDGAAQRGINVAEEGIKEGHMEICDGLEKGKRRRRVAIDEGAK